MKDQVDALRKKGLSAASFDSTKSKEDYIETMSSMRDGTLKLLYCAPERLNNEGFVAAIKNCRGGVRLVAVDEAHCIR
jgi:superfamily II DNA helicase RecQ